MTKDTYEIQKLIQTKPLADVIVSNGGPIVFGSDPFKSVADNVIVIVEFYYSVAGCSITFDIEDSQRILNYYGFDFKQWWEVKTKIGGDVYLAGENNISHWKHL